MVKKILVIAYNENGKTTVFFTSYGLALSVKAWISGNALILNSLKVGKYKEETSLLEQRNVCDFFFKS